MDLLYLARDHDLPPKWDGHPVAWQPWTDWHDNTTAAYHREPPVEVCEYCGHRGPRVICHGIAERPDGRIYARLTANRCPDCKHDQVLDFTTETTWDLGPEDYGDDGSVEPGENVVRLR